MSERYYSLAEVMQMIDEALCDARDAVRLVCGHTKYEGCRPCPHDDAVAAIDGLRGTLE